MDFQHDRRAWGRNVVDKGLPHDDPLAQGPTVYAACVHDTVVCGGHRGTTQSVPPATVV